MRELFTTLQGQYPHSPIELLSPLAEGADQLAAEVALECNIRLIVPLPMPVDLYKSDFKTPEVLAKFESLIGQAASSYELPLAKGISIEDVREEGESRNHQYGVLGAYIVRNSHALLALWDGVLPERSNGTADVVGFNLNGIPEAFVENRSLLEPDESDPVWHIVTPRASNPTPVGTPLTMQMVFPSRFESFEQGKRKFHEILESTDQFNHDAIKYRAELADEQEKSKSYLIDPSEKIVEDPLLKSTIEIFAVADSLAGFLGASTHKTLKVLFLIVTAAAIIFDVYTHVHITVWPLLATYLLLLVLTYLLVVRSQKNSYQSRYLDYRALAEGVRVRFFWSIAGISDEIADHYLHKQRSELDWIRYALRVWNPERSGLDKNVDGSERLRLLQKYWVEDQFRYYTRAAKREEGVVKRAEKWAGGMVIVGILLAFFQVIQQGVINPSPDKHPIHWLLVAVALAPILAGLLIGYVEKRAHGDHAKQYERMSILFANAREHLSEILRDGDVEKGQRLISELGREALAENGDWVLIHRDRPIEVPKA
ncbi:MAG: hypothetical protein AB7H80_04200 [Candidatus Kapaibacterium sp.]